MLTEEYDPSGMKDKIKGFPDQIIDSYEKGKSCKIEETLEPRNIVVTGMGGSAIAGDLLQDLLFQDLKIPIFINRGYGLPAFVNDQTLLLISSYSGNTEETIYSLNEGLKRNATIVAFTSNGEIENIAMNRGIQAIIFPKGYPPRSALGFSFFSMLGLIKNYFNIPFDDKDIVNLRLRLLGLKDRLVGTPNETTELAKMLKGQISLIYITRRLKSIALRWQTQINENSKTFVHINMLPEANHNEIVGLQFPKEIIKQMHLIFLRAEYYEHKQVKQRFRITEELLRDKVGNITTIISDGHNKLEDMFFLIYKGDFLSYYLSQFLRIDPTPVKRIDLLKKRLKG